MQLSELLKIKIAVSKIEAEIDRLNSTCPDSDEKLERLITKLEKMQSRVKKSLIVLKSGQGYLKLIN